MYMMMVMNLETVRDKCSLPINDPYKTDFQVGDMVLYKNRTQTTALDIKYNVPEHNWLASM